MPSPKLISRDRMLDLFGYDLNAMSENAKTEAGIRGYRYRLDQVEHAINTKTIAA